MLRLSKVPRKHSNYSRVRRASARLLLLTANEPIDYRALSIAMSSAPLEGLCGDYKVEQERKRIARGEQELPKDRRRFSFDDLR